MEIKSGIHRTDMQAFVWCDFFNIFAIYCCLYILQYKIVLF